MSSAADRQISVEGIPVWRELEAAPVPAGPDAERIRVTVVGAGPVGLAMAVDLAQRGHEVVLLGKFDFVAAGSKAICFSKRSLDILDRLGVGEASVEKGVTWNVGKVFWQDSREPIYQFDLLPVKNQKMPAFINMQQYYMEDLLLDRIAELPGVEFRPGHEVLSIEQDERTVWLGVGVGDARYEIESEWVIACDGCKSFVRKALGLDFEGRVFEDNFLIADVRMKHDNPPERWFWFDPPFNPGQSALMHMQPDGVWRLDFQLGWDIDRDQAVQPENVERHVRAMLGADVEFREEWYSVYTFQCRRMERFVHDRIVFAGDSAHLVSPFGARGCNGGFADIDNLGWKLDLVLRSEAEPALIETYDHEAVATADANIQASTRSADFLTPKSKLSEIFRDAVLELASEYEFARGFVNSGRLSVAISYPDSPLNTPDEENWGERGIPPGTVALDAPMADSFLLEDLHDGFVLLTTQPVKGVEGCRVMLLNEASPIMLERFALEQGGAYLIRPDQYVAARWTRPDAAKVATALIRARGG